MQLCVCIYPCSLCNFWENKQKKFNNFFSFNVHNDIFGKYPLGLSVDVQKQSAHWN